MQQMELLLCHKRTINKYLFVTFNHFFFSQPLYSPLSFLLQSEHYHLEEKIENKRKKEEINLWIFSLKFDTRGGKSAGRGNFLTLTSCKRPLNYRWTLIYSEKSQWKFFLAWFPWFIFKHFTGEIGGGKKTEENFSLNLYLKQKSFKAAKL